MTRPPSIELQFARAFLKSLDQTLIRVWLGFFNVGKPVKAVFYAFSAACFGFVSFKIGNDQRHTGLDLTGAGSYTVKGGDTLSAISRNAYNDGFYYPIIMLASRGVVENPDKIQPGMELTLPDLERNKASAKSRKSMKNCFIGFTNIEKAKPNPNQGLIDGFMKHADEL